MNAEAHGLYGVYGQEITESNARLLGLAIGTRLAGGHLVVGGDVRASTPALKRALIDGVLGTGCHVYDVGILPTPALHFARDRLWADGTVMVTASHRSACQNGFEISLGKMPCTPIDITELREVVRHGGPFAGGRGRLYTQDVLAPYISFLIARFVPVSPLRVVVDANNGSMSQVAVSTLRSLGHDVVERNCTPDGSFGDRTPDPGLPEHEAELSESVLAHRAHLGVAYDGDGDRVVFADERGTVLSPEQVLVLLARTLLPYQPGSQVVFDASYEPSVAAEVRRVGGQPVPVPAAGEGLKRVLLERGAVLGGDALGHYFFRTMGGDDALHATLVMLRISNLNDGALAPLVADLPVQRRTRTSKAPLPREDESHE